MDFTQPNLTTVVKSTKGKSMFWYGDNRTGKTANAVKMPKPFAIPFENGLNAIAGLPFQTPEKWADTKKIVKQFQRPEVKEMFETIIVDTADKMGEMLIKYICAVHSVESIGEANNGFGAYSDINKYLSEFIDPLIAEGYTVVIIGHDTEKQLVDPAGKKYTRIIPRGDKRVIQAICDAVDIIGYCDSNGFDEETGDELLSTIYLKDAKFFKAGSRWSKMPKSVNPFTVSNLTKAIVKAIEEQEGEDGKENYTEKQAPTTVAVAVTFEEVQNKIKECMDTVKDRTGNYKLAKEIVEKHLGEGGKVSECNKNQQEVLEELLEEIEAKIADL